MTTARVVETSVTVNNNSPIQDDVHPDDQTQPTLQMTLGFKPFTALWLIRFSLNEIPSSGCNSSFTLLSIASFPYQVISGTNVHNSSKYTTVIHTQLFQRRFSISKSISCRRYCQCSLEYCHPFIRSTQRQFLENICSEDDLRSRIFGIFVVKLLACLPLLKFSNV